MAKTARKASKTPGKSAKKSTKAAKGKAGKMIYFFGAKKCDGDGTLRDLLGGKGANLAQMTKIGLPVPPGFTITTDCCVDYYQSKQTFPAGLEEQIAANVKLIEKETGKKLGDPNNTLLVSVRSGARDSMPGMMDTILNLGLNNETVVGLAEATGNGRFAYDSYRRFIQMYSDVVLGVDHYMFEEVLEQHKLDNGLILDTDTRLPAGSFEMIDFAAGRSVALALTGASVGGPIYPANNPPIFTATTVCPSGMTLPQAEFLSRVDLVTDSFGFCGFGAASPALRK